MVIAAEHSAHKRTANSTTEAHREKKNQEALVSCLSLVVPLCASVVKRPFSCALLAFHLPKQEFFFLIPKSKRLTAKDPDLIPTAFGIPRSTCRDHFGIDPETASGF